VKTVVLGPRPRELEGLIQRRRALGIDAFDEVWEGSYHAAPAHPAHGYVELIVADPTARTVTCWALDGAAYRQADGAALLTVSVAELQAGIAGHNDGRDIEHPIQRAGANSAERDGAKASTSGNGAAQALQHRLGRRLSRPP
jgi:hypothetical protein